MPSSCCVPECHQKGDLTPGGTKVNYFDFPRAIYERKKWIHAIRRVEGQHFRIRKRTKVCSLHFRSEDFRKSLNGRIYVRAGVVPSKFSWSVPSPTKRKPPRERGNPPPSTSRYIDFSVEASALGTTANEVEQQQRQQQPEPEPSVDSTSDDCKIIEESCQETEDSDSGEQILMKVDLNN